MVLEAKDTANSPTPDDLVLGRNLRQNCNSPLEFPLVISAGDTPYKYKVCN